MAQVRIDHVYKLFGDVVAVDDVSLMVEDGEFVVLVGPSGCGKTTTLRMIAGLEEISQGYILIGETVVNHIHPRERDVAMVFQSYALYPHMTIEKNLSYGLKMRRLPADEIRNRVRQVAQMLQIDKFLDRKPAQLSGGQRQRVALGRAIVRRPAVFLMDEPLSNLDAKLRVQMRDELIRLHHHLEATTIYVTHDQIEAMTMGDRVAVMNQGKVQQVGPPLELYRNPKNLFVASFIGSPQMNLISGHLRWQDEMTCFINESFRIGLSSRPVEQLVPNFAQARSGQVMLGFRPEHIHFSQETATAEALPLGPAQIEYIEHLGRESFAGIVLNGRPLIIEVNPDTLAQPGDIVEVSLNRRHVLLFDAETTATLPVVWNGETIGD